MTFRNIIDLWSKASDTPRINTSATTNIAAELAQDLTKEMGLVISASTVGSWKTRDKIPPEYWKFLILCAERRGYDVTAEILIDIVSQPKF